MSLLCNSSAKVIQIGKGAYGTVYLYSDKSALHVIKIAKDATEERAKHLILWNSLPDACKKYFPKPLPLPGRCRPRDSIHGIHAMEYVKGVNMHEYVKHNFAMGNKEAIKIVTGLLKDAIMCLWRAGFIHMDLHMRNVIVTHSGIKIIDFGMSEKVTPLSTPKTKKELSAWFTNKYKKALNKIGLDGTNPNLYAYGIKTHKMYYKPNQKLYNSLHKLSSIKKKNLLKI